MYLYLSIHFFIQNVSLKLIWYCWSNLNKNFRFEANLTTKRTVNASCLSLDCVIGQYTSCTHVVVAHFLESTLLLLFFHLFLWTFRPTLGSPSFICPSFRFVTHIALSWLSFNNNNTYIAPISILLYIYISAIFISFILIKCLLSQSVCKTWQRSSASEQRMFPWSLSEVQINIPYHENRLQVLRLYSYKL